MTLPESAPESAPEGASRNLFKTLVGVFFMYGSRGLGLLLTFAIIARLGIADYGLYALAFSFATILGPPLDNPWAVRAIRESEDDFNRERSSRYLVGVALVVVGLALLPFDKLYLLWFGFAMAGGEMAFNSLKSRAVREGHPDLVWRYDAIRQTSSVVLVCAYLFAVDDPSLKMTSLLYCAPYVVILVLAGAAVRGHRPGLPGSPRQMVYLTAEMGLGTAAYLQGDVLLLGFLTNSTVVGYYNITLMLATALAGIGQSFAMTYHEPLRKSGGDLKTGPKLRLTLTIASAVGAIVLVTGVVMLFTPAPAPMAQAMVIMAGFCFLRTVICVFQVILYAQRRDRFRLVSSIALLPVKLALLTVLVKLGLGAVAAAIATTAADAMLLAVFANALYGRRRS